MTNYAKFKRVFLTKKNAVLVSTIRNSQKREARFTQSGNANGSAVEIDRIQAAVDVLEMRGYYNGKTAKPTHKQATDRTAKSGLNIKAVAAIGLVGLWFFVQ